MSAATKDDIRQLEADLVAAIEGAEDEAALEAVRVASLGKKGSVSGLMKSLGAMSPDERKVMGPALNGLKTRVGDLIGARKVALETAALNKRLETERVDVTLPVRPELQGSIHPVSQVIDELVAIFADMEFAVAEGPDIEDDFHNFTALNFPPAHPAREMHDTFFLEQPEGDVAERQGSGQSGKVKANQPPKLLRTHTSPVQIRHMLTHKPPIRIIVPGRTYRCNLDQTHTPMFHQIEGLVIDKETHMGHLKGCLISFIKAFFEVEDLDYQFRPHYFPFTEPSAEMDIGYSVDDNGELKIGTGGKYMEILGCGMVHPNVLRNVGLDPDEYQGFAFGLGVDRLAMLKYGITDLRPFFEADVRWLEHYGFRPLDMPTLAGRAFAMKFTLSWLKEHLETDATLDEIVAAMTGAGLEVEEVTDPATAFADFKVAHVIEAKPHPDADKLRVCQVDTGKGVLEVVCGAPNARTGMKGVFAPVGTQPPNVDFVLKKAKIRGVESNGMLCSEREMGLSEEHDGIIDLPEDTPIGTPFAELMGLNDPVIDFEVTPNRPDWNGVDGIARDLAAAGVGTLKTPTPKVIEGTYDCPVQIELRFDDETKSACTRFAGRLISGVKNGPSPQWLQQRLKAIGLRPINALVDMTNYISYDRARPLHVYDADKLKGVIHARLGEKGEKYLALDGETYEVDATQCVIADDNGVLGYGGVMGGEDTGCTEETVNVFIECAVFDPIRTAQTGRKTGIVSDARYRFERGVDPEFVLPGLNLATEMVLDMCGGEPSRVYDASSAGTKTLVHTFDPTRVLRLTGMEMGQEEMVAILSKLGFGVEMKGKTWDVSVPSWRPDVEGAADLVEEIARIHGFEHLPATPLPRTHAVARPVLTLEQSRRRYARRAAASRGLREAVTYSFTHHPWAQLFGGGAPDLNLANPISSELAAMRPSLLPNLLAAMQRNVDRGFQDVALFEVGPQYGGTEPEDQIIVATGLRRGGHTRHWAGNPEAPDALVAKADVMGVLAECGAPVASLQVVAEAPSWYHPGRSGTLQLGPKVKLATFGELHPGVLAQMDVNGPVVGFEIFIDRLPAPRSKGTKSKGSLNASDLQRVERDFAFIVDASVEADKLVRAAQGADKKLISSVTVFDLFEGPSIGEGKKSIAISVALQPRERTLTDDEIDAVGAKVVAAVQKATGGALRM